MKNKSVFNKFKLEQQLAQLVFNDLNKEVKDQLVNDLIDGGYAISRTYINLEGEFKIDRIDPMDDSAKTTS